jgi:hypothetical protein
VRRSLKSAKGLLIFLVLPLGGWSHLNIPPECDHEPRRPYVVRRAGPWFCGGHSLACSKPEVDPAIIWIQHGLEPNLVAELLRHEKAHINCPWWVD